MSDSDPWGPGHVIADKYRLTHRLGKGGMGSVWAADHLALHSAVAVKIIDPAIAKDQEALARFMREAQSAAALRSPHVVQTFDYGVEDGVPFIAMELLEGQSLAQRIEQLGKLTIEQTATILTQVGRAISRAHDAGIVHRDLKPDNIFLVRNDDEEVAKVLDFGIAKDTGSGLGTSSQTRTGAILGTPYYMSPEQAEGNRKVDHRTDLWSLAIIAYECVIGQRPFESEALGDLILQICVRPIPKPSARGAVPPGFDEWFEKGTQRDPAQRFQSAREMMAQLRAVAGLKATGDAARAPLQTQPEIAERPSKPAHSMTTGGAGAISQSRSSPPKSQIPTPLVAGATIGAMALVAGIVVFALRARTPTPEPEASPPAAAAATSKEQKEQAAPAVAPAPATPAVSPAVSVVTHDTPAPAPSVSAQPATAPSSGRGTSKPAHSIPERPAHSTTPAKPRVDFGF